jgi:ribonuclease P protein subunit RPR2
MKNKFKKKKQETKIIAQQHIVDLFKEADAVFKRHPEMANKYVALARRISSRLKVKIPLELKRKFCKHCGSYLRIGTNARVRLNKGKKSYFCMNCGKFTRIPYK